MEQKETTVANANVLSQPIAHKVEPDSFGITLNVEVSEQMNLSQPIFSFLFFSKN